MPGLGWIFVAQVSVLAHIRRTENAARRIQEVRFAPRTHLSVAGRKIGAGAVIVVLTVLMPFGALTLPTVATVLGLLLCWLGGMAMWTWSRCSTVTLLSLASVALALLGATCIMWVHPIPVMSSSATMFLIVCAIGVWMAVVVQEVLEIAG